MQKKSSAKSIGILILIIALAGLAYFYFSGSPKDSSTQLVSGDVQASDVTNEVTRIITLLNQTSSLRIDPAIFNSSVYKSLVDHTVSVVEQPVGKPNPFLYSAPAHNLPLSVPLRPR